MNKVIVNRLFESFRDLEQAISAAKTTLERRTKEANGDSCSDVLHRINSYHSILQKQRDLATTLCGHMTLGNWPEVARHIKLINGLSSMIRDDAREILGQAECPKHQSSEDVDILLS